jgi:hypothetical protein
MWPGSLCININYGAMCLMRWNYTSPGDSAFSTPRMFTGGGDAISEKEKNPHEHF